MSLEGKIRVLPHLIASAAEQLAIDRTLLVGMERQLKLGRVVSPVFRTYRFSKPAVILGYKQKREGSFNHQIAKDEVDLTMRDSGGGHLFFSTEDFNFSFICPDNYLGTDDLIERYKAVNKIVIRGFNKLSVDAVLGRTSIRLGHSEGKIVAGTARKNGVGAGIQQGIILTQNYSPKIFELLMVEEDDIRLWKENIYIENFNHYRLREAILDGMNYYELDLSFEEIQQAKKLVDERYSNPDFVNSGFRKAGLCLISEYTKDKEISEANAYAA